jgi:cystathionine gamma-lyase
MVDMTDFNNFKNGFKKNTKMVWVESPTNPTLKCLDIQKIAAYCKQKGAMLVVDNTFMSPCLQSPLKLGADICLHSITKYIGGHSDVLGGALMFNEEELYDRLHFNIKSIGTMMAPFDAWIAFRGCKTVKLRVLKSAENALVVAKWLEKHPKIEKVLYPGLPSHPHHKIALKNRANTTLSGGSGMLGFYIKGDLAKTNKFLSSLELITLAESLGGVESLIESPALMTHGSVPVEIRKSVGIDDNYCRFSTGIEEVEDIIADMK